MSHRERPPAIQAASMGGGSRAPVWACQAAIVVACCFTAGRLLAQYESGFAVSAPSEPTPLPRHLRRDHVATGADAATSWNDQAVASDRVLGGNAPRDGGVVAVPSERSTPAVPLSQRVLATRAAAPDATDGNPALGRSNANAQAEAAQERRGAAPPAKPPSATASAAEATQLKLLGCFRVDRAHRRADRREPVSRERNSPAACVAACREAGFAFAELTARIQCWCGARAPSDAERSAAGGACELACPGEPAAMCGGGQHASVYAVSGDVSGGDKGKGDVATATSSRAGQRGKDALPLITFYVEPAKTRNAMFLSGRLSRFAGPKYRHRTVVLNSRLARNTTAFRHEVCVATPGFKVFVGHGELVLTNWPGNCVWSVTGDEAGDWGLRRNGKYYGLHGPGSLFLTNESAPHSPIVLPAHARPWFRQYYDARQVEAFGSDVRFWPLGSRLEFPDIDPRDWVPASKRRYVYSFMAAVTDPSRRRLLDVVRNDTIVPAARAFVHVSDRWHAQAGHSDYVGPAEYAAAMQESAFALCPKGHSVEQFRIYEALEAGAVPVLELNGGYLQTKLPPEYFADSGLLFVESWADAPEAMWRLAADGPAMDRRQRQATQWYARYMRSKLDEIESVLESNPHPHAGSVCARQQQNQRHQS